MATKAHSLAVRILEKAQELGEIGAGIQLPPNAMRVMDHYGLISDLADGGATKVATRSLLRYSGGNPILIHPGDAWYNKHFGQSWCVMHRADYHNVLLKEAKRLGAVVQLNSEVVAVDIANSSVLLASQERVYADIIIGADGLRSVVRDELLGYHAEIIESGDLAYRATIPKERVKHLQDPVLEELSVRVWLGPRQHAVLYPLRNGATFNLVLICSDDLPLGVTSAAGNVHEMRELFKDWDSRLTALIAQVDDALKWKICYIKELENWCQGSIALLGDACHPTLPYQAQGAAMAVEDGAVLGVLLGKFSRSHLNKENPEHRAAKIAEILQLYESIRKDKTTLNVQRAMKTRELFHLEDGPKCDARNETLAKVNWDDVDGSKEHGWGSMMYLRQILGNNSIHEAEKAFEEWIGKEKESRCS
ncbi:hypothetical protein EYZ11_009901 [Aspergillus tanneri]|uniref:FAD-binding domain-containing protein n=1 Tax=Aspergillus tanneri TaxID=1220188 RepID=A0A4S3J6R0_9EURO|nr:uncharacterized protein ATNIH1004_007766 [Aspergillus tanneri]KAA8646339.1 hypothetical protein ATNIH1004_007766 [Aspergillus tanneri]THC90639.1 hypothetical protein EYZ11_009901 [Aspergillus tanneri]